MNIYILNRLIIEIVNLRLVIIIGSIYRLLNISWLIRLIIDRILLLIVIESKINKGLKMKTCCYHKLNRVFSYFRDTTVDITVIEDYIEVDFIDMDH